MSVIGRPAKPLVSLIWINLDEVRRLAAASYYALNYRGAGYYTCGGPHASYAGYPVQDYATLNGFVCHPSRCCRRWPFRGRTRRLV
jgi:hypothetical protein